MTIAEKIYENAASAQDILAGWKANGDRIVFTNGCFDIIHIGHVLYLEQAKKQVETLKKQNSSLKKTR